MTSSEFSKLNNILFSELQGILPVYILSLEPVFYCSHKYLALKELSLKTLTTKDQFLSIFSFSIFCMYEVFS